MFISPFHFPYSKRVSGSYPERGPNVMILNLQLHVIYKYIYLIRPFVYKIEAALTKLENS